ncbi:TrbC family F-type conjugative pilus assembly protein [Endozoicomonas arenosclerae]|uniref:TrbC family F-type conjugative pilus assembly protein n=1 Tax=Endozoicomonas arenosclerae TaxID=1633495 RepID=UPI0007838D36|nr:TrbC family F-type conjugative pilus assembly protein [Endozoicomonas arenosclerae]
MTLLSCSLGILLSILPASVVYSSITINLYVSESMGESTLVQLLQDIEPIKSVNMVIRGMAASDSSLIQTITRWQTRIKAAGTDQGIQINPVAYRDNTIERVPAITLSNNSHNVLTVFGVTSIGWAVRQYHAGRRGNIGTYGSTYPINEPDMLEVLLQRLQHQNWHQVQVKATQRLEKKVHSYGVRLPTSRQSSSKTLSLASLWRTPIIALDIYDKQHRGVVAHWLRQYPDAMLMVSQWSYQQLRRLPSFWHQHLIYLLPKELVYRFQLSGLPALMTPESNGRWQVTTAALPEFSALDIVSEIASWAKTLLENTAPSALALETTENPSKALCQNVPILSEKLMTSVPWKELFPIRIGLAKLGSGKEPNDRAKTSTGLCFCEDSAGMFHPGVTTGFWRPQRLIELTRSPGCLMAMGGHKLPIVDQRRWGTLGSANIPKGLTYLHAHVYSLPLIEMLNMFTGIGGCTSDLVDFDLMNLSEVDPSWNHPELAALLSPDLAAYSNPSAINACTADGLAALNTQPKDSLHWCAGSWGNLYPLSGFTSTYGHFSDNTSLLATRALAKIHRIGLGRKTIGEEVQCHSRITPWLPKSQYKMSMFWPEPEKQKAHWIGASAATWGMHRHPLGKDDAMYLLWQYRDCCQTAVSQ